MSRFTDTLVVSPLPDGRTWVIRSDFGYDVGEEGSGDTVNVPVGFKTDFASVPRLLWIVIPRWGTYGNAAVVHDYLYWSQERPRREADQIMREGMRVLGTGGIKRAVIYRAVRWFGWYAWRSNRRLKEKESAARIHDTMTCKMCATGPKRPHIP